MNLNHMSNKQQISLGLIIVVIVMSVYGFARFLPESKSISSLEKAAKNTQQRILKNRSQDEPTDNLDQLLQQIQDQEQAMALIKSSAEELEARLAAFDSQELKVRISQLANSSRVRIKSNQAVTSFPNVSNKSKKKKKKKSNPVINSALIPASQGWLSRLAPGTVLHRPLQRIKLEGTFQNLQQFIHGLDNLPWQVTVIQMQLQKLPAAAPVGLPQLLNADLVLAL